jgi:sensor histidine kinase YesM
MHKKAQHKQQDKSLQMDESQGNKIDLFLLSRQVDELCNQINDCGIPIDSELLKGLSE